MISPHHHEKRKILLHFFGIGLIIIMIGVILIFDKPIRTIVEIPRRLVAGSHDVKLGEINKETFKDEITADSKEVVDNLTYQAMNVTISDLVVMARRTEKILKDVKSAKEELEDFVHSISLPKSLPLNK